MAHAPQAHKMIANAQHSTLVMKFGGTSVGTAEAMAQAVEIIRRTRLEWPRLVVILSALSGVTNLLLESAVKAERGDTSQIEPARQQMRFKIDIPSSLPAI